MRKEDVHHLFIMREDGAIKIFMDSYYERPSDTTTSFSFVYINKFLSRRSKRVKGGSGLLLKAMRIPPKSNLNKKSRFW